MKKLVLIAVIFGVGVLTGFVGLRRLPQHLRPEFDGGIRRRLKGKC
jgi:hypothetical protein